MAYNGFDITNQSCLVVGGTSGIGKAVALALVQSGARVVVGSTNPDKVAAMQKELGEPHDAVQMEAADETSVRRAVEAWSLGNSRADPIGLRPSGTTSTPQQDVMCRCRNFG